MPTSEQEIRELQKRITELEKALEPFAKLADLYDDPRMDIHDYAETTFGEYPNIITVGDCRRARALLPR